LSVPTKIKGRKRHVAIDTPGMIVVTITPACVRAAMPGVPLSVPTAPGDH